MFDTPKSTRNYWRMLYQLLVAESMLHCTVSICVHLIFPIELKSRFMLCIYILISPKSFLLFGTW